jgi:hypothetical protein
MCAVSRTGLEVSLPLAMKKFDLHDTDVSCSEQNVDGSDLKQTPLAKPSAPASRTSQIHSISHLGLIRAFNASW